MKILLLSFALLFSACSTKPWSVIDGSRSNEIYKKNRDVYISGIDGKAYFDNLKSISVEPGFHYLKLTTTKPDRNGTHTYTVFPIVTQPCVRYLVTAQHESGARYDNESWEVRVLREEPIESCLQLLEEQKMNNVEEKAEE